MPNPKIYIGDGIYAEYQGYCVVLTTENGICVSNTIVMEKEHVDSLYEWFNKMRESNQ